MNSMKSNQFNLYDLEIAVERIEGNCTCDMSVGDKFQVKGGKISMPDNKDFCLFALQSVIPLIPVKQRKNDNADWIETDNEVTCPDPACRLIMKIKRTGTSIFYHEDVSNNPIL